MILRIKRGRFAFHVFFVPLLTFFRKGAGVADRGGLENRCTFGYPGFESLPFRLLYYLSFSYHSFFNLPERIDSNELPALPN